MPDWLTGFFNVDGSWSNNIWNALISVVRTMLTKTPKQFAPEAWELLTTELYPWFLGAGAALLNLFFFVGFVRQNTNLKENVTMEVMLEGMIKVIIANVLMQSGLTLMEDFIDLGIKATKFILRDSQALSLILPPDAIDLGAGFFMFFFSIIYVIASLVCGVMILVEVMKRYLYLMASMVAAPIGLCTLAGGRGLENTAYAWIKTFFTYAFQIIIIALILRLGALMGSHLTPLLQAQSGIGDMFDGALYFLNNLVFMIFMTTAVTGSDNLLSRMFGLR